jgi:hypothetical protein
VPHRGHNAKSFGGKLSLRRVKLQNDLKYLHNYSKCTHGRRKGKQEDLCKEEKDHSESNGEWQSRKGLLPQRQQKDGEEQTLSKTDNAKLVLHATGEITSRVKHTVMTATKQVKTVSQSNMAARPTRTL